MKINVEVDYLHTFILSKEKVVYSPPAIEVAPSTWERWAKVIEEFHKVQEEIGNVCETQNVKV